MGNALISRSAGNSHVAVRQETGNSTSSVMSQNACTNSFSTKSHTHSASDLTSGTLPVSRGGTGSTSASGARSNLGMTIESGSWTPTLSAHDGNSPTYSIIYRHAKYIRINNLVYITFHLKANIGNAGSGYACVKGLPFTAGSGMNHQGLAVREMFGAISNNNYSESGYIPDSSAQIDLQTNRGAYAAQWSTGDVWVGFSGCYIKS